jgi:hypothetical protein
LNGDEKNAKKGALEGIQFYLEIERYTEKKGCLGGGVRGTQIFSFAFNFLKKLKGSLASKSVPFSAINTALKDPKQHKDVYHDLDSFALVQSELFLGFRCEWTRLLSWL